MDSLPEELVIDILSRLAAEDIISCKSVQKSWYKTVSDPFFKKFHLSRSITPSISNSYNPNTTLLVLRNKLFERKTQFFITCGDVRVSTGLIDWGFRAIPDKKKFKVEGVCKGLVLLSNSLESISSQLWLWNPIKGDSITIKCPFPFGTSTIHDEYQLGYDVRTNKLKIIRVLYPNRERGLQSFRVNNIGEDTWRKVDDIAYPLTPQPFAVVVNGNPHWMAERLVPSYLQSLYAFDMHDESFRVIPHPTGVCFGHLAQMDEFLAIFRPSAVENCIWVMDVYGLPTSWTKKYVFVMPLCYQVRELLSVTIGGEIVFRNGVYFVQYSPRANTVVITTFGLEPGDAPLFYKGSLMSPKESRRTVRHLATMMNSWFVAGVLLTYSQSEKVLRCKVVVR